MKQLLFFFIMFSSFCLFSQDNYSIKSKKAIKYYEKAIQFYNAFNNQQVIIELNKAIKVDHEFVEAYLLLAEVYTDQEDYINIIDTYKKAIEIDSSFFLPAYYNLANAQLTIGKYEDALKYFRIFLDFDDITKDLRKRAIKKVEHCLFAIEAISNPVPFEMIRMSDSINTFYNEYWPSLTADGNTLVFTSLVKPSNIEMDEKRRFQEDFFISRFKNGYWSKAHKIPPPLNTSDNEGAQSLTVDGKMMYFTACNRMDGVGKCDIYLSRKVNKEWSKGINLGRPVNSPARETQPSISPDGKILYFTSNRTGGKGKMDIWQSNKTGDNKWSSPKNLGNVINTSGNEISPFIHSDNQTLYFASDGLKGMGRFDLYMCKKINDSVWSEPLNLGYPINTFRDEIGMIVNAFGNKAYFSSNRQNIDNKDLYEFELYSEIRPDPVSYMRGKVYDSETKKILQANFELIDVNENNMVMSLKSDNRGEFFLCLPSRRDYALNVSKKGYMFFSEHFSLKELHNNLNPYLIDIYLNPIKAGEKIVLKNIFYEFDSYDLRKESFAELEKIVEFLNDNSDLKIEISGHTDNIGTKEYNLALSENRAKSVVEYLSQHSVNPERISYKGYGKTKPIETNDTEEGKALNRRTELMIISSQ